MHWKWMLIIFAVADFWGIWFVQHPLFAGLDYQSMSAAEVDGVPYNIELQYIQTNPDILGPQGAYIYRCMKDNEVAYRLIIGGGGDATEYYFNAGGISFGTYHDTDVGLVEDAAATVILRNYCGGGGGGGARSMTRWKN